MISSLLPFVVVAYICFSHVYKYGRTLYYLGKIQRIHFKSNRSQTRQRVAHTRSNSLPTAKAVAI